MSSKNKLEKILEYKINGEEEKAAELLRSYIIEKAAEIHQSLVDDEDALTEIDRAIEHGDFGDDLANEIESDKEEIKAEEMFGEDEEIDHEDAVDDLEDELEIDHEDESELEDLDFDDLVGQVEDVELKVNDLSAQFDELAAQFEEVVKGENAEEDEEEYDDGLDESIELKSVKVDTKDTAPGSKEKSPVASSTDRLNRLGGKPVKMIDKGHKGFDRETKTVDKMTKHSNVLSGKASAALSKIEAKKTDTAPGAGPSPAFPNKK